MKRNVLVKILAIIALIIIQTVPIGVDATTHEPDADGAIVDEELRDEIDRQIGELDLSQWQEYLDKFGTLKLLGFDRIDEMLTGYATEGTGASADQLWLMIWGMVKAELSESLAIIIMLTAAAMMTGMSGMLSQDSIRPVLSLSLCTVTILLVTTAFSTLSSTAISAINDAAVMTQATLPLMSVLLAALGATSSAGIFRPLMLFLSSSVISVIETVIMPIVLASGIVSILEGLAERIKFGELVKLLRQSAKWLLGLLTALYFAITALQGMSVAATDGISIRTAKYAIDKLVPVVGSMVSGTVDGVMGCALLVKNAAGMASIVIMFVILLGPMIKLAAGIFIFRVVAALTQPVADQRVVKILSGVADASSYLFAAVAATGSMFALTMGVIIASGGITAGLW